jgi:hypothetical protein
MRAERVIINPGRSSIVGGVFALAGLCAWVRDAVDRVIPSNPIRTRVCIGKYYIVDRAQASVTIARSDWPL